MPQDPGAALNPALRIDTQLREALSAHPGRVTSLAGRIEEVLDEVSLSPELLRRYPHQLSGGQQQRVALAIAFAARPGLVVLDEPTTGLDVTTQRRVLETVRTLCKTYGAAAVYVSHDLAVVAGLASTVAVMYAGRLSSSAALTRCSVTRRTRTHARSARPCHRPRRRTCSSGWRDNRRVPAAARKGARSRHAVQHAAPACLEREPQARMSAGRVTRCIRIGELGTSDQTELRGPPARAGSDAVVLRASELNAWHGHAQVLYDVSLEVPERSCVAIVGESGSGKTTLAGCISGLHRAYSGTITFHGEEMPPGARRRRPRKTAGRCATCSRILTRR